MLGAILLLILGLVLIFLEFYLPGAILGILGSLFIVFSVFLFASAANSWIIILLYIAGVITSIAFLIRFALWRIVHAKPEYSIYHSDDQEGYQASEYDASAVGKEGIVTTDLKPGGYIMIEGIHHAAISVSGYIIKGERVKVIGGQEANLIVQSIKEEKKV